MANHYPSPFARKAEQKPHTVISLDQAPHNFNDFYTHGENVVVDLIPASERKSQRFLRGASLGAAVVSLALDDGSLNPKRSFNHTARGIHFAHGPDRYDYALNVAGSIARGQGYIDTQLPTNMRTFLADAAHQRPTDNTPGIIFGLDPTYEAFLRTSDKGAREGLVLDGAVTLDMIDERSREYLTFLQDALGPDIIHEAVGSNTHNVALTIHHDTHTPVHNA